MRISTTTIESVTTTELVGGQSPANTRNRNLSVDSDVGERLIQYFMTIKSTLLSDWDEEYKLLVREEGDEPIERKLKYYHKFANFMCNDRMVYFSFFLQLYYTIAYLAVVLYAERYELLVFYASVQLVFVFAMISLKSLKGSLLGKLTDNSDDINRIGYYELLDLKYRYIKKQEIVNIRRESVGVISGKDMTNHDITSYNKSILHAICSNQQWKWMLLVLINIIANSVLSVMDITVGYNDDTYGKHTRYVYYYYFFLWGVLNKFIIFFQVNYVILIMASMIHAGQATHDLCSCWIQRLEKCKKISLRRFNMLSSRQFDRKKDEHDVLPTAGQIQLDLYERYLFIVGALSTTSHNFGFVAAAILGSSVLSFLIFAYLLYKTEEILFLTFMLYVSIAFFGTVASIAYANTSIDRIVEVLRMSVPRLALVDDDSEGDEALVASIEKIVEVLRMSVPKLAQVDNNPGGNKAVGKSDSDSPKIMQGINVKADINRVSDFEIIGGRDCWIAYITEVPGTMISPTILTTCPIPASHYLFQQLIGQFMASQSQFNGLLASYQGQLSLWRLLFYLC